MTTARSRSTRWSGPPESFGQASNGLVVRRPWRTNLSRCLVTILLPAERRISVTSFWRRLPILLLASLLMVCASASWGQEVRFLRIGTGGTGGTYFPIGGLIASVISKPPGSRDCEVGGSCGVPGLIATAVSTQGSVENVQSVQKGELEMALTQADVAYYAYSGEGVFADGDPLSSLRAMARLYPEVVHIVVRAGSDITSVADLAGRRVSVGEAESGTLVASRLILAGYALSLDRIEPSFHKLGRASDLLIAEEIDAFFMVGGHPLGAIGLAAENHDLRLVSISGEAAEAIVAANPFFARDTIPAGQYRNIGETETLSVSAQLIASEQMHPDLAYRILRALWHPNNRPVLDTGHPNAAQIRLESALDGIAIPLHPGAARFYEEVGLTRAGVY
ncbi:MAG: TAXI family TRAP transporter solute-binding subunit [Rhodospirillales bacterium]|nr:MAG: TAXI family TRAP transporter solute-binding subunit [Rhodospirillales bacterium]